MSRLTLQLRCLGSKLAKGWSDRLDCGPFRRSMRESVSFRRVLHYRLARAPRERKKRTQSATALDENGKADKSFGANIFGELNAEEHEVKDRLGDIRVEPSEVGRKVVDLKREERTKMSSVVKGDYERQTKFG